MNNLNFFAFNQYIKFSNKSNKLIVYTNLDVQDANLQQLLHYLQTKSQTHASIRPLPKTHVKIENNKTEQKSTTQTPTTKLNTNLQNPNQEFPNQLQNTLQNKIFQNETLNSEQFFDCNFLFIIDKDVQLLKQTIKEIKENLHTLLFCGKNIHDFVNIGFIINIDNKFFNLSTAYVQDNSLLFNELLEYNFFKNLPANSFFKHTKYFHKKNTAISQCDYQYTPLSLKETTDLMNELNIKIIKFTDNIKFNPYIYVKDKIIANKIKDIIDMYTGEIENQMFYGTFSYQNYFNQYEFYIKDTLYYDSIPILNMDSKYNIQPGSVLSYSFINTEVKFQLSYIVNEVLNHINGHNNIKQIYEKIDKNLFPILFEDFFIEFKEIYFIFNSLNSMYLL